MIHDLEDLSETGQLESDTKDFQNFCNSYLFITVLSQSSSDGKTTNRYLHGASIIYSITNSVTRRERANLSVNVHFYVFDNFM